MKSNFNYKTLYKVYIDKVIYRTWTDDHFPLKINTRAGPFCKKKPGGGSPPKINIFLVFVLLALNSPSAYLGKVKYQRSILTLEVSIVGLSEMGAWIAPPPTTTTTTTGIGLFIQSDQNWTNISTFKAQNWKSGKFNSLTLPRSHQSRKTNVLLTYIWNSWF